MESAAYRPKLAYGTAALSLISPETFKMRRATSVRAVAASSRAISPAALSRSISASWSL
jgi:hypothetical protein